MEDLVTPASAFWAGKRVLLTGHTGFKGAWATVWLERLGAVVSGVALAPTTRPSLWDLLKRPPLDSLIADVRDGLAMHKAFAAARPEIVIHMAAQALVHPSYDDPVTTFETNVLGVVNVLEAARATPSVRAVINITSDKCYDNREHIWAYREDEPMGGSDPYSASKGCAELVTASYRKSYFNRVQGPWVASGRAGNVVGGGDWSTDRLAPDCVRAFEVGEAVLIRNPLATRPWQHVLEPVCGYLVLAQAVYERGSEVAEGWNFGPSDEDAWPVGRVVEHLVQAWGDGARWSRDTRARPQEAMLLRVDATKARLRLGWRPRLAIGEALDWTVEWYKAVARGESAVEVTSRQIEHFESRVST